MTAKLPTRRTVLTSGAAVAGAVAGATALTACGAADKTESPANAPAGSSAPAQAAGQPLGALADIPVGEAKAAKTSDGKAIVVARPTDTTAAAFSAICTHKGCTVEPAGAELKCPCHGSVYDAVTGAVKKGPANKPLPAVSVTVAAGQIVTA